MRNMYREAQASIKRLFSLRVSSFRSLHSVGSNEISRNHRATCADDPKDYAYQKTNEELDILHERSGLVLHFVKSLAAVFSPRDVTQPVHQSIGGRIQSIAYRHGNFLCSLAISNRLS